MSRAGREIYDAIRHGCRTFGRTQRTVNEEDVRVYKSAILIDSHNDVTSSTVAGLDIGKPDTDHMTDIARMGAQLCDHRRRYPPGTARRQNRSAARDRRRSRDRG